MQINKWWPHPKISVYLGKSQRHARSISLVLNPKTGDVSPQFHVKYDDTFKINCGVVDESLAKWKSKGRQVPDQGEQRRTKY
jgi:hypothetical protein